MKLNNLLKVSMIFLAGFLFANLLGYYFASGLENPFLNGFVFNSSSASTPSDFVKENQIEVYADKVVIKVKNAGIGRYAPTGSMEPVLDENSNGIRIIPESEEQINIGDIITFEKNNELIIHRVIEKGIDKNGTYFITKGDNNDITDGKIRFNEIKYLTIGVIW